VASTLQVLRSPEQDVRATWPRGDVKLEEMHSFRFLDKYRISHVWLSGVNIHSCRYFRNVYRQINEGGDLMRELNGPLFESNGVLSSVVKYDHNKYLTVANLRAYSLGVQKDEFEGFRPFCTQVIPDSRIGFSLSIIKPGPNTNSQSFVDGGVPVNINGLKWLRKSISATDPSQPKYPMVVPIEIWVLKIPDTSYWMVLRFSINPDETIQLHYDDYVAKRSLFNNIIESVKLEPITPLDYKLKN
jgi:hypothetical protein